MPIEGHENREYSSESQRLTTSEAARRWTETSPRSKLVDISEKLANYNGDDAEDLRKLIENGDYKEFQKRIGITGFKDLDGKLGPRTLDYFNNYLGKTRENYRIEQKTNKKLKNLQDSIQTPKNNNTQDVFQDYVHRPEYQKLSESAKIHKNAREYLSKNESLSKADYDKLFYGKEQLTQGADIGNCYLIAGLMELVNTGYFESLMRSSISRVQFKDGATGYNIRIPLGQPDGRDILIKDDELSRSKILAGDGYRLLEIAYVKNRRPNNREGNKYSPVTDFEYKNTRGGRVDEVIQTFLGKNNVDIVHFWNESQLLSTLSPQKKEEIKNILKNLDTSVGNRFISLVTPQAPGGDSSAFVVGGKTIYNKHVYSLRNVQKDENGNIAYINIDNTWNREDLPGGKNLQLTFDEFLDAFSYMGVCNVALG